MQTVLVIDDHLIVRQSLKNLIENASNNSITAEECSGQESLKLIRKESYQAVLIGLTLTAIDPIELLKQIRDEKPDLPILVLCSVDEEQYYGRLFRAGVTGVLTRESAADEFLDAIKKILSGGRYISPSLAEKMTGIPSEGDDSLLVTLSDREYEVMSSMVSGKRVKQIADEMSLSIKTVSTYHSRILQKLRLDNDAQLIRYAIEQGVIRDSIAAREKLIMSEFNIRTASLIQAIKEIWRQRKLVIIVIGILGIITYFVVYYLIKFVV
ncbi:MAG: response regulator transcription factor [Dehalococcoidales bacterium]|nr:MAG: response regulator transcription factor [Dehalococcoidales bacterium]